jgi:hypothetical protein
VWCRTFGRIPVFWRSIYMLPDLQGRRVSCMWANLWYKEWKDKDRVPEQTSRWYKETVDIGNISRALKAIPQLRRLVAGFPPWRAGHEPETGPVESFHRLLYTRHPSSRPRFHSTPKRKGPWIAVQGATFQKALIFGITEFVLDVVHPLMFQKKLSGTGSISFLRWKCW